MVRWRSNKVVLLVLTSTPCCFGFVGSSFFGCRRISALRPHHNVVRESIARADRPMRGVGIASRKRRIRQGSSLSLKGDAGGEIEGELAEDESVPASQTSDGSYQAESGSDAVAQEACADACPEASVRWNDERTSEQAPTTAMLGVEVEKMERSERKAHDDGTVTLRDREGFDVVEAVLPGGGQGLVMDLDGLVTIRSKTMKLKRSIKKAVKVEDYRAAGTLKKKVEALRAKDPLCVVTDMLGDAVTSEKFQEAAKLRDAKDWMLQESQGSVFDVDRLVCLSNKAQNIITTDPEGLDVCRFLEKHEVVDIKQSGQIQLPVWSPDGRMLAFTVLSITGRSKRIKTSRIIVFREGGRKLLDVHVPRAPFLLMWSPNSQTLTYLSNVEGPTIRLSEILVTAAKTPRQTKSRVLAQGNPLFYSFTKKNPRNADLVIHTDGRVYALDMTTGEKKRLSSSQSPLFMAPSTHCIGGEDAVLLVEGEEGGGQHLVSMRTDGSAKKRLCPTRGFSTFAASPNGKRVCLMQQDLTTGFYTMSVLQGSDDALDPRSTATMEQVEIPLDRVIMAFFFSPDSRKLLCLSTKIPKGDLSVARSSMRLGFKLKFQWAVYDCETRDVVLLEEFSPRPFFLKMYLPYFDMFSQGFTPWAPDSGSFAYVSNRGAFVQEVPEEGLAPSPRILGPNMEFVSWSFC